MPLRLHLLGGLDLRGPRAPSTRHLLRQPKRIALLVYLAQRTAPASREALLGLFWPDSSPDLARASLRKALHHLRRTLGDDVFGDHGEPQVAVDRERVWCDLPAFHEALTRGDPEGALALYGGDLLPGFVVREAPEFERWLEVERARLRERALGAATGLAERAAAAGRPKRALFWARRAAGIAPDDERPARLKIELLARTGARVAALEAWEELVVRLRDEYELEPSAALLDLERRIRGGPEGDDAGHAGDAKTRGGPVSRASAPPSRTALQRVVAAEGDLVARCDLSGRVTWIDAAVLRRFGPGTDAAVGRPWWRAVPRGHRREAIRFFRRQVRERIPITRRELPVHVGENGTTLLEVYVRLIEGGGAPVAVQVVARAVSARPGVEVREGAADPETGFHRREAFRILADDRLRFARRFGLRALLAKVELPADPPRVAARLREVLRDSDLVGRVEPGLLAILALESPSMDVHAWADVLRRRLAGRGDVEGSDPAVVPDPVSLAAMAAPSADDLLAALKAANGPGRSRVETLARAGR